ncbi:hypothetical protein, partial [Bifidobacterium dolichotidis]|uniref:hypothetical protein n=1 Tax=Bifidobacterium dolichotidis TaxID=2306976 RepID=UPI0019D0BC98
AKPWHGDGTAFERMWESSTPPLHNFSSLNPETTTVIGVQTYLNTFSYYTILSIELVSIHSAYSSFFQTA